LRTSVEWVGICDLISWGSFHWRSWRSKETSGNPTVDSSIYRPFQVGFQLRIFAGPEGKHYMVYDGAIENVQKVGNYIQSNQGQEKHSHSIFH